MFCISNLVAFFVFLSLTWSAQGNFVLQTEHTDPSCHNASLVSWSFFSPSCVPTLGGTYARYECDTGAPVARFFSQPDCRPASSIFNSTLSTSCSSTGNRAIRYACAPLDLSAGAPTSYSVRYQYFSQQVCQSNLQNVEPVNWYQIVGLRNDYCAPATASQMFGSSKHACISTSIQSTFCVDSSCQSCGPASLQYVISTCAPETVAGNTLLYSFGVCVSPSGVPLVAYNYSAAAFPPLVPPNPSPSQVRYVAQIDYGSSDCSVASARSFRSYDVSVCHPGDMAIPAARNYSCVDGVPQVTFVTSCASTGSALSTTVYSTACTANQRWLCVADEVPYPALGGLYDRKWRDQTQSSCIANGPSTFVTEGSFATCIPSRAVNGLFTELRCAGLDRFERVCVDPECTRCMPTSTKNNATECASSDNGLVWSGRKCLDPTWTLAQSNPPPPTDAPIQTPVATMPPSESPQSSGSPIAASAPTTQPVALSTPQASSAPTSQPVALSTPQSSFGPTASTPASMAPTMTRGLSVVFVISSIVGLFSVL